MAYFKCSVHVVFGFRGVFGQICFGLFCFVLYSLVFGLFICICGKAWAPDVMSGKTRAQISPDFLKFLALSHISHAR